MNYREQQATGTEWRRCTTLHIYNPLEGQKECRFDEETVIAVGGRALTVLGGYITKVFEPATTIALLDPETGLPTGTSMTHGQLYQVLYSLYIQTAMERDADEIAQAAALVAAQEAEAARIAAAIASQT